MDNNFLKEVDTIMEEFSSNLFKLSTLIEKASFNKGEYYNIASLIAILFEYDNFDKIENTNELATFIYAILKNSIHEINRTKITKLLRGGANIDCRIIIDIYYNLCNSKEFQMESVDDQMKYLCVIYKKLFDFRTSKCVELNYRTKFVTNYDNMLYRYALRLMQSLDDDPLLYKTIYNDEISIRDCIEVYESQEYAYKEEEKIYSDITCPACNINMTVCKSDPTDYVYCTECDYIQLP